MDVPANVNEAAKRLRAVKESGHRVVMIERVYGRHYSKSISMLEADRDLLADWLLETFPEVGR